MLTFAVSEEKNKWLREHMEALGIQEKDIEEKFIRSSGHGGQNINKTATCVYLKHLPTGIEVKCMQDRSQSINRFLARRELVKRIEGLSGQITTDDIKREKIRKQKAKSKRRTLKKMETKNLDSRLGESLR
ncbi:MAG: peptide chain release factor-like protein [Thermodesulfovibrionales bacterium]